MPKFATTATTKISAVNPPIQGTRILDFGERARFMRNSDSDRPAYTVLSADKTPTCPTRSADPGRLPPAEYGHKETSCGTGCQVEPAAITFASTMPRT